MPFHVKKAIDPKSTSGVCPARYSQDSLRRTRKAVLSTRKAREALDSALGRTVTKNEVKPYDFAIWVAYSNVEYAIAMLALELDLEGHKVLRSVGSMDESNLNNLIDELRKLEKSIEKNRRRSLERLRTIRDQLRGVLHQLRKTQS